MIELTPFSIAIIAASVLGFLLVPAINRIKDRNRLATRILTIFVLLLSATLMCRVAFIAEGVQIVIAFPQIALILDLPLLTFGPLLYLYIVALLYKPDKFDLRWCWHFTPAAIHFIKLGTYLLESNEEFLQRVMTGNFDGLYWLIPLYLIHVGAYLILSFIVLQRYNREAGNTISFLPVTNYVRLVLGLIGFYWVAWLYSVLPMYNINVPVLPYITFNTAWMALSFTTFILAYFVISKQEFFKVSVKPQKYETSGLSEKQFNEIKSKLSDVMLKGKPHLNSELTLSDLADKLGTSLKNLSRVINEGFGQNFFDFVNTYRITEFKELARSSSYKDMTLLAIAYEAGFNSKTTFNTAFKKITNQTPTEYIKNITN